MLECCGGERALRLMDHMLFCLSRLPSKDLLGSVVCSISNDDLENMALYPLSQNCAMDSKALFRMSGNKWQRRAASGMCGMSRSAVWVASMDMLLGSFTVIPGAHFLMSEQCALMPKKWLVQPESAIAVSLL